MSPQRPSLLLVLLVAMPLALLVWLGTYLHSDGERREKVARYAVMMERLQVANHQLLTDLRLAVRKLDQEIAADAQQVEWPLKAGHDWVLAGIAMRSMEEPKLAGDSAAASKLLPPMTAFMGKIAVLDRPGVGSGQFFEPVAVLLGEGWKGFRLPAESEAQREVGSVAEPQCGLLVREGGGGPEFIHWHLRADGCLLGVLLDSALFCPALFENLPPAGLKAPPGRVTLMTASGDELHGWGLETRNGPSVPEVTMNCGAPFQSWELGYEPASTEFPTAALFPILLGVSSGGLLVPSLAWLYFRESSREIRVAQQRVSFVNQVSHELKTPLTNIRLYAEMARGRAEDREDATAVRQLAVVESETARLSRLIQNVLNFARKQRDRLTVNLKRVDLALVIARVAEQWTPVLEKRGITLEVDMPDSLLTRTDADAVEQILGNLLSNAEKYAADGLWVGIRACPCADESMRVEVADRGPGIPVSKQEQVFEPFERLRCDLREGVSGTGIGLTISRELADLLGGRLFVDSERSEGACFVLTLPAPASEKQSPV